MNKFKNIDYIYFLKVLSTNRILCSVPWKKIIFNGIQRENNNMGDDRQFDGNKTGNQCDLKMMRITYLPTINKS